MTAKSERRKNRAYWRKKRLLRPNSMYHRRHAVSEELEEKIRMANKWKYKIKVRVSNYYDYNYTLLWYNEQERLRKLLKELQAVNIFFNRNLKSSLSLMVDLVNVATHFYDNGLIKVAPDDKVEAVNEFNSSLSVLACREKNYHGFWNQAPIGGTVTLDNLYLAVADKITAKAASKLPKPLVIEYEGEFLMPLVPYKPLREWATKRQKSLFNGPLVFDIEKFVQATINVRSILQKNIEDLLK